MIFTDSWGLYISKNRITGVKMEDMGILRILLWHVYEHYDPLTEDLLGEDRYVKS